MDSWSTVSGDRNRIVILPDEMVYINGVLRIGDGGVYLPNRGDSIISGGLLTSSVDKIDFRITGSWPSAITRIRSNIVDSGSKPVGIHIYSRILGPVPGNWPLGVIYMEGEGDNSFTGDVVIDGLNELSLRQQGTAVQGNIYAVDKGVVLSHRSGQIGRNSKVTLRSDGSFFGFHTAADYQVTERFHQLVVERGSGKLSFWLAPPDEFHGERSIFLDDLMINEGSRLTIESWKEGFTKLLVRKDSEHLKESLGRLEFEGYRKGSGLREYDETYWEIFGIVPEPTTYGAIMGLLGVGVVVWHSCRGTRPTAVRGLRSAK